MKTHRTPPSLFLLSLLVLSPLLHPTLSLPGTCLTGEQFRNVMSQGKEAQRNHINKNCYAVNTKNLKKLFPNLESSHVVGEGGFGTVYQYTESNSLLFSSQLYEKDASIAVKVTKDVSTEDVFLELNNSKCLAEFPEFWEKETSNLVVIDYCYYDGTKSTREYYLTLKYYPYTLEDFINETVPNMNYEHHMKLIMLVLSIQLNKMHERGLLHRDIKPANVVLSERLVPHFIDFGTMSLDLENANSFVGTYTYMSPAVARETKYKRKSDLFSLGLMFHNLIERNSGSHFQMLKDAHAPTKFKDKRFEDYALNVNSLEWPDDLKFLGKLFKDAVKQENILSEIITKLENLVVQEHAMLEKVKRKSYNVMTKLEKLQALKEMAVPASMREKSIFTNNNHRLRNQGLNRSMNGVTPRFELV